MRTLGVLHSRVPESRVGSPTVRTPGSKRGPRSPAITSGSAGAGSGLPLAMRKEDNK